jgi:hypothetical protein
MQPLAVAMPTLLSRLPGNFCGMKICRWNLMYIVKWDKWKLFQTVWVCVCGQWNLNSLLWRFWYSSLWKNIVLCMSKLYSYIHNVYKMYKNMWMAINRNVYRCTVWLTVNTHLLTYCMEQRPSWEANRFSASQEILRIVWTPKVHYRIHKCPSPVPNLSHLDPVYAHTSHFLKIHLNVILPFTPGSSMCSISLRFPYQNPVYSSPKYVLHVPPISFFSIWSYEQYAASSTVQ